jgi:nucleoside-diphosphate-sugar epimerase
MITMRVFVTGATGFIGSAIVRELIASGHSVLGMARNDAGAQALRDAGATVHSATLEDLPALRAGAGQADAVIHTAFIHDFARFRENCAIDSAAIEAMGAALAGSSRPLIVTSGLALLAEGRVPSEDDPPAPVSDHNPRASEHAASALAECGVRTIVVRLPQVHDTRRQGFVSYAVRFAREKGSSAYVGEGRNRWAAAHLSDVARLYRLALEKNRAGARYHAVAEEGVPFREIADAIAKKLSVPAVSLTPDQAAEHFGWYGGFAAMNLVGSSSKTREELGWKPAGPTLLADLAHLELSSDGQ